MWQNRVWAIDTKVLRIPLAAEVVGLYRLRTLSRCMGGSDVPSTFVVALNAQLLRRPDLNPERVLNA